MADTQISSVPAHMDIDPTSSLEHIERSFFTNFSCCNLLLPDLHALLEHYELSPGDHAMIHTSSRTPSLSNSPTSSPPPTPDSLLPVLPYTWPIEDPAEFQNISVVSYPDDYAPTEYPTYEHCYQAATATSVLFADSDPQNVPTYLPLSSGSASPSPTPTPVSRIRPAAGAKSRRARLTSPDAPLPSSPKKAAKKPRDAEKAPLAKSAGRRKDKAYPCPTPGCSKAYLNPNGLKYHQEKGTCKIDGELPAVLARLPVPTPSLTPMPTVPPAPAQYIYQPQPRPPYDANGAFGHWQGTPTPMPASMDGDFGAPGAVSDEH